jgi:hypothetical protein
VTNESTREIDRFCARLDQAEDEVQRLKTALTWRSLSIARLPGRPWELLDAGDGVLPDRRARPSKRRNSSCGSPVPSLPASASTTPPCSRRPAPPAGASLPASCCRASRCSGRSSGGRAGGAARWNDWVPASKNLKTRGVRAWNRARRRDDAAIALWADHPDGPPPATAKRRVTLVVERRRRAGRLPDPQNLQESLFDALVANGLLVDDSGRWMSFGEPDVRVNPEIAWAWRTTIRLEE